MCVNKKRRIETPKIGKRISTYMKVKSAGCRPKERAVCVKIKKKNRCPNTGKRAVNKINPFKIEIIHFRKKNTHLEELSPNQSKYSPNTPKTS